VPHDVQVSDGQFADDVPPEASAVAQTDGGIGMTVAHFEHVMDCGCEVRCWYCCLVAVATLLAPLMAPFLIVSNVCPAVVATLFIVVLPFDAVDVEP